MAGYNRIILVGNLVDDPKLRYTPNSAAVGTFRLAVNTRSRSANSDEGQDETLFIDVVTFGRQAETCAQYLAKGRQVLVEGRLRIRSWEGQDGQRRYRTEVAANTVQFLGSAPAEETRDSRRTKDDYSGPQDEYEPDAGDASDDDEPPF